LSIPPSTARRPAICRDGEQGQGSARGALRAVSLIPAYLQALMPWSVVLFLSRLNDLIGRVTAAP
jgi:hypothetical protein